MATSFHTEVARCDRITSGTAGTSANPDTQPTRIAPDRMDAHPVLTLESPTYRVCWIDFVRRWITLVKVCARWQLLGVCSRRRYRGKKPDSGDFPTYTRVASLNANSGIGGRRATPNACEEVPD